MQEASMPSDEFARAENERIAANRAAIFTALRADGVLRAVASYAGLGDSGGPECVRFELPDGATLDKVPMVPQYQESARWVDGTWQITTVRSDRPLEGAVTDLAMELLDQHFGGWAVGAGASGEVVFDAMDGSVTIEHYAYCTNSDYSEVRL